MFQIETTMIWNDVTRSVRFSIAPLSGIAVMFLSVYGFVSILRYMKKEERTLITVFYPVLEILSIVNAFYFTLSSCWSASVYTGWFMKLMNWFIMICVIFSNLFCSAMACFVLMLASKHHGGKPFSVSEFTRRYGAWMWGVCCSFSVLTPSIFLGLGFFSTAEDAVWSSGNDNLAVDFTIILLCGYQIFKIIALVSTLICLPWAFAIFRRMQKEVGDMENAVGDATLITEQRLSKVSSRSDRAFFHRVMVSCVFVCVQAILEFSGSISKYLRDDGASKMYMGLTFLLWPIQIIIITAPYEINYWMGWFVDRP